jgi:hypothetical protein
LDQYLGLSDKTRATEDLLQQLDSSNDKVEVYHEATHEVLPIPPLLALQGKVLQLKILTKAASSQKPRATNREIDGQRPKENSPPVPPAVAQATNPGNHNQQP